MRINDEIEYLGKCLFLKRESILVIGDLHLGYEEILNKSGVLVTRAMFSEMIDYFDSVFRELKRREKEDGKSRRVNEIVLLGDVKHGFARPEKQEWNDVIELFDYFIGRNVEKIIVVKGNHDNYIKNIAGKRNVFVEDFYFVFEEDGKKIGFCHGDKRFDELEEKDVKMWIMGHGHPAMRLRDEKNGKEELYKCFLVGKYKVKGKGIWNLKEVIIAPSFIDYSEGTDARENDLGLAWDFELGKFNVRIISDSLENERGKNLKRVDKKDREKFRVWDFGKLKNLRN